MTEILMWCMVIAAYLGLVWACYIMRVGGDPWDE